MSARIWTPDELNHARELVTDRMLKAALDESGSMFFDHHRPHQKHFLMREAIAVALLEGGYVPGISGLAATVYINA